METRDLILLISLILLLMHGIGRIIPDIPQVHSLIVVR
jgi:hypothetical protein